MADESNSLIPVEQKEVIFYDDQYSPVRPGSSNT